ncbi:hypothetical protein KO481_27985 [Nocardia sp. NEAU-G5]|uniref:Uncharacterized protein n=1 Tax=Nocardia albiluteola TaxID=2842303 RepID=A0ABS6B6K0_9NOCA|nr:hypothetical protein [Nocardia albiluteola]MBU3065356.1 hypothetical protein [Nocardia albiluteola]
MSTPTRRLAPLTWAACKQSGAYRRDRERRRPPKPPPTANLSAAAGVIPAPISPNPLAANAVNGSTSSEANHRTHRHPANQRPGITDSRMPPDDDVHERLGDTAAERHDDRAIGE